MIPIKNSLFVTYFDEIAIEDLAKISLLDDAEASELWFGRFGQKSKGFHDLPSVCWVIQGPWHDVGSWIEAFNGEEPLSEVALLVERACGWPSDEIVFLVQSSKCILRMRFCEFLKHWDSCMTAFNDGPILISESQRGTALSFVPMGNIMKTNGDR